MKICVARPVPQPRSRALIGPAIFESQSRKISKSVQNILLQNAVIVGGSIPRPSSSWLTAMKGFQSLAIDIRYSAFRHRCSSPVHDGRFGMVTTFDFQNGRMKIRSRKAREMRLSCSFFDQNSPARLVNWNAVAAYGTNPSPAKSARDSCKHVELGQTPISLATRRRSDEVETPLLLILDARVSRALPHDDKTARLRIRYFACGPGWGRDKLIGL